jgi:hypothetical protein
VATRSKILEQEGAAYCGSLLAVVRNITKEDTVLYALVLIHQLLQGASPLSRGSFTGLRRWPRNPPTSARVWPSACPFSAAPIKCSAWPTSAAAETARDADADA